MPLITFGPFRFESSPLRLVRDEVEVKLRPQAMKALAVLASHRGRHVGHDRMIAEAWDGNVVSRHTVDVTVGEVRRTLGEYGSWIAHRPKVGYCLAVPRSDEQIRRGQLFWNLRTREGFEKALECFAQAAVDDASDFRAFEGQSVCYLMLFSQGMRAPHDMYQRFLSAHGRAEALVGLTPELRCNRAHGWHMFERRLPEALAEFGQILDDHPAHGPAYVRLTMLYATLGRLDDALVTVHRAYAVDPLLPLLPATNVFVRFWRREFDEAVAVGAKAVELHPFLQLGRAFYAQALEFSGRFEEALMQYRIGSVMSPELSWLRALQGACLVKCGREEEAWAVLEQLERLRCTEYVDAYGMAVLRRALGQNEESFAELERAVAENSAGLFALEVDPKMDGFRADPRYRPLVQTFLCGPVLERQPLEPSRRTAASSDANALRSQP
jgi:DNA-binding winged helix-turn-helix (wHTH) protein